MNIIVFFLTILYNLFLIIGTAYLVNSGWSMWTFVLTALFLISARYERS